MDSKHMEKEEEMKNENDLKFKEEMDNGVKNNAQGVKAVDDEAGAMSCKKLEIFSLILVVLNVFYLIPEYPSYLPTYFPFFSSPLSFSCITSLGKQWIMSTAAFFRCLY